MLPAEGTKAQDVDIAARALFVRMKLAGIEELEGKVWDELPDADCDGEHPGLTKAYYREDARVCVEALYRAGRLVSKAAA
jgi:hypothetical protein